MVSFAVREQASTSGTVPPLESGDNLTPEEFERIWELHPEVKRAELIDGLVYVEMVVGPDHGASHIFVATWAGTYWAGQRELEVLDNASVRLADGSIVQPDVVLRRRQEFGGRSIRTESAIEGPPELVVEVAASSAAYDLHQKRDAYERNGVGEYVVWQLFEERIDWFVLRDGRYTSAQPDEHGVFESIQFPGLRLRASALLAGDLAGVLRELSQG